MPGCQAVKQNGTHCRNYACKGKTCCYVHIYLEDTPAEIEVPVVKKTVKKTKESELWGPPERTVAEDGTVEEVQYMKSFWEPTHPGYSGGETDSESDDDSGNDSDDPDYK